MDIEAVPKIYSQMETAHSSNCRQGPESEKVSFEATPEWVWDVAPTSVCIFRKSEDQLTVRI